MRGGPAEALPAGTGRRGRVCGAGAETQPAVTGRRRWVGRSGGAEARRDAGAAWGRPSAPPLRARLFGLVWFGSRVCVAGAFSSAGIPTALVLRRAACRLHGCGHRCRGQRLVEAVQRGDSGPNLGPAHVDAAAGCAAVSSHVFLRSPQRRVSPLPPGRSARGCLCTQLCGAEIRGPQGSARCHLISAEGSAARCQWCCPCPCPCWSLRVFSDGLSKWCLRVKWFW